jgi:hypothetical protein
MWLLEPRRGHPANQILRPCFRPKLFVVLITRKNLRACGFFRLDPGRYWHQLASGQARTVVRVQQSTIVILFITVLHYLWKKSCKMRGAFAPVATMWLRRNSATGQNIHSFQFTLHSGSRRDEKGGCKRIDELDRDSDVLKREMCIMIWRCQLNWENSNWCRMWVLHLFLNYCCH